MHPVMRQPQFCKNIVYPKAGYLNKSLNCKDIHLSVHEKLKYMKFAMYLKISEILVKSL